MKGQPFADLSHLPEKNRTIALTASVALTKYTGWYFHVRCNVRAWITGGTWKHLLIVFHNSRFPHLIFFLVSVWSVFRSNSG